MKKIKNRSKMVISEEGSRMVRCEEGQDGKLGETILN